MRFIQTDINGLVIVELEPRTDERGFFTEAFVASPFAAQGLKFNFHRCHFSMSEKAGTIRGMHYQAEPCGQVKLIYCLKGKVLDVAVDVRAGSTSYGHHVSIALSEDGNRALYIPDGFAHGVQALTDRATIMYMVAGGDYSPKHERGLRPDDPALGIRWPLPMVNVSPRDLTWPLLSKA